MRLSEIIERVDRRERIPTLRGTCRVCLRRVPLRQDGTCGSHQHWLYPCGGTGKLPAEAWREP